MHRLIRSLLILDLGGGAHSGAEMWTNLDVFCAPRAQGSLSCHTVALFFLTSSSPKSSPGTTKGARRVSEKKNSHTASTGGGRTKAKTRPKRVTSCEMKSPRWTQHHEHVVVVDRRERALTAAKQTKDKSRVRGIGYTHTPGPTKTIKSKKKTSSK